MEKTAKLSYCEWKTPKLYFCLSDNKTNVYLTIRLPRVRVFYESIYVIHVTVNSKLPNAMSKNVIGSFM